MAEMTPRQREIHFQRMQELISNPEAEMLRHMRLATETLHRLGRTTDAAAMAAAAESAAANPFSARRSIEQVIEGLRNAFGTQPPLCPRTPPVAPGPPVAPTTQTPPSGPRTRSQGPRTRRSRPTQGSPSTNGPSQASRPLRTGRTAPTQGAGGTASGEAGVEQVLQTIQTQAGVGPANSGQAGHPNPDLIQQAIDAAVAAQNALPGKLAVTFKSGACCLYADSSTGDYIQFMAAGSKGRWVHHRGWGPKGHPAYTIITPAPSKIIADAAVSSSWCSHAYLLRD